MLLYSISVSVLLHSSASTLKSHLSAHSMYTQHEQSGGGGWALTADLFPTASTWSHQIKLIGAVWRQGKGCGCSLSQGLNWRSSCKGTSWGAKVYMGSRGKWSVCERHPCRAAEDRGIASAQGPRSWKGSEVLGRISISQSCLALHLPSLCFQLLLEVTRELVDRSVTHDLSNSILCPLTFFFILYKLFLSVKTISI